MTTVGEPIPASDATQYKLTWTHDRDKQKAYEAYFTDNDPEVVIAQVNRVLTIRQLHLRATACFIHLKEIGGRTLCYNRGF